LTNSSLSSNKAKSDCLPCRIWGGLFHLGVAAFVGSHYKKFPESRASGAFIILFSAGVGTLGFVRLFDLYNPVALRRETAARAETAVPRD